MSAALLDAEADEDEEEDEEEEEELLPDLAAAAPPETAQCPDVRPLALLAAYKREATSATHADPRRRGKGWRRPKILCWTSFGTSE